MRRATKKTQENLLTGYEMILSICDEIENTLDRDISEKEMVEIIYAQIAMKRNILNPMINLIKMQLGIM